MQPRLAYSLDEAANLLGLSRSKVKELVYTGALRSKTVGRRRIIPHWAVADFLADGEEPTANKEGFIEG